MNDVSCFIIHNSATAGMDACTTEAASMAVHIIRRTSHDHEHPAGIPAARPFPPPPPVKRTHQEPRDPHSTRHQDQQRQVEWRRAGRVVAAAGHARIEDREQRGHRTAEEGVVLRDLRGSEEVDADSE